MAPTGAAQRRRRLQVRGAPGLTVSAAPPKLRRPDPLFPMHLRPFRSTAALVAALAMAISPCGVVAQGPITPPADLLAALHLRDGTVQSLTFDHRDGVVTTNVLLDGTLRRLELRPHDLRAPDFKLLVDDGKGLTEVPAPPSVTYRGRVAGVDAAPVAASLIAGRLTATVHVDGKTFGIQPLHDALPGSPADLHLVYRASAYDGPQYTCGVTDFMQRRLSVPPPPSGLVTTTRTGTIDVCEIALDADEPYYRQLGGSTTAVQNDLMTVMNAIDVIYQRDCEITYTITAIIVRTTPTYFASQPSDLLNAFSYRWNNQHTGVQRDVAHLFTGRALTSSVIGIAELGVVCAIASAYALSWSRYTTNFSARVALTAHELGHNWAANHCNTSSSCAIMCSRLGGCSGILTGFSPAVAAGILAFRNTLFCVPSSGPPPTLTSATPSTTPSHAPPIVTLRGQELDTVLILRIGGQQVGFSIVDPTTIQLRPPSPFPIGTHPVVAINRRSPSNSLTLNITGNHPSQITTPVFFLRGTPAPILVHTDAGWQSTLLASSSLQPSTVPGVLSLGIGAQFNAIANFGLTTADRTGTASYQINLPSGVPIPPLHWQAVTFDPTTPTLPFEVSDIVSRVVF